MNKTSRVKKVLNFEAADRLPVLEWASWWDKTIERWEKEGLPRNLNNTEIMEYFGLDVHKQFWISARGPSSPPSVSIDDYKLCVRLLKEYCRM